MNTPLLISPYRQLMAIKPIVYPPPYPERDKVVKKARQELNTTMKKCTSQQQNDF